MPFVIVVGVQWGDEGKGKVVDYLTERANLVVRFQGGNNAGHTVIIDGQKIAFKLIPSGIMRSATRCLLASGVVIEPTALLAEMDGLREIGVEISPERLGLAGEATLILPYHKAIDAERENALAKNKIGTTGKGIGPAYEDSVSRYAIRLADLFDKDHLHALVERNVDNKNRYLSEVLGSSTKIDPAQLYNELCEIAEKLGPYVTNVSAEVAEAHSRNDYVVFEGAQGCLLDINHGTFPFVTSSHTLSSFACVSAGFGPKLCDLVLGICKAYATRVGSGPFPTEDEGADGDELRAVGKEFGTVTGRPRRCGWFDAIVARRAVRLNGIDTLVLTKLDVLTGFPKIKIATSYSLDGNIIDDLPVLAQDCERVEPIYEELPGWQEDLSKVRSFSDLPVAAQNLIRRIESLVGCEVGGFSVGPDRKQTIIMNEQVRSFAVI